MTDHSRSLLAAAREGLAPDAEVAARVRAKVAAATNPAPTPAAGSSVLVKLGAALVVVGLAATAVVVARSERAPDVPRVAVTPSDADEAPARVHVAAPNDPLVLPDERRASPARARVSEPLVEEAALPPERPAAQPAREPASLSREVELIDLAMVSLRKNAPLAAIEAIRVFDRETFGRGQMAEEAAAIEIEARCVLREDVTAALARFDRDWPESAQRERIQRTCFARR